MLPRTGSLDNPLVRATAFGHTPPIRTEPGLLQKPSVPRDGVPPDVVARPAPLDVTRTPTDPGGGSIVLRRRASYVRVWLGLVVILAVVAAALPGAALALVPTDGPALTILPVAINASGGDQFDPHVDGNLVSYTSDTNICYYDFFTGNDVQVPAPIDANDRLSDVSNGKIVFSRDEASGRSPIMVFDTATATTTEVDVQPLRFRIQGAIGSNTVAFVEDRKSVV